MCGEKRVAEGRCARRRTGLRWVHERACSVYAGVPALVCARHKAFCAREALYCARCKSAPFVHTRLTVWRWSARVGKDQDRVRAICVQRWRLCMHRARDVRERMCASSGFEHIRGTFA